jgi:hypothetical protein
MKNKEVLMRSIVSKKLNTEFKSKVIQDALEYIVNESMKDKSLYPHFAEQDHINKEQIEIKKVGWDEINKNKHSWLEKYIEPDPRET